MSRLTARLLCLQIVVIVLLAGCTRGQPDYGVNAAKLRQEATNSNSRNGKPEPGSRREFSQRAGDTVYFTTDSNRLSRDAQATLVAQARWLNQHGRYAIMIEGHADERGTREYNIALGASRANAVKRFLISRGVDPRRVRTVSYGKERPVAVCANISCWSRNRRAVTVLDRGRVSRR